MGQNLQNYVIPTLDSVLPEYGCSFSESEQLAGVRLYIFFLTTGNKIA